MSPEVNGNPPSVTKRKKNREKKVPPEPVHNFDLTMPSCNYFPINNRQTTYAPTSNFNFPEMGPNYYPFVNCSNPSEPMSLPVYPVNGNYPTTYACMGSFGSNLSRHSSILSNHTFNVHPEVADYMSLPVAAVDPTNEDDEEATKRRFSDPGLPNDSDSGSHSCDDQTVRVLAQQMQSLKASNNRLSREVMELRIELNLLKQQQSNRHYEKDYEPGMLADVIREVREAARVREDALLARVKHIIEERDMSLNQLSMVTDKNRNNDRISKLEEQLKSLTVNGSSSRSEGGSSLALYDGKNASGRVNSDLERETMELRKELRDTRARKEEADQKIVRLSNMLRRNDLNSSDVADTHSSKAPSVDAPATPSTALPHRVILTGPVTSL